MISLDDMASVSTSNIKAFAATLRLVAKVSKKDFVDIVNNALRDVAYRAASFTPKTTASKISQELKSGGLLPRLAALSLNRRLGKNPKCGPKIWGRKEHRREMAAILKRRRSGVNAIRAGWIPAIQQLGGSFRGAALKPGSTASGGIGSPATLSKLHGFIRNTVRDKNATGRVFSAAEIDVAVVALNQAIQFVTVREIGYAQRKIEATLRKFSA